MALLLGLLAGSAGTAVYAVRAWRQPPPGEAVPAAAARLAAAPGMSYSLRADSAVTLLLAVDWRAAPHLMRVTGEVRAAGSASPVTYWVTGDDLYVRDPQSGIWRLSRSGAHLPEVAALLPTSLAQRLRESTAGAHPAGRDRSDTGEPAWAYDLPGQGRLLLRRDTLAPLLWRTPLAGGGSLEVRWHALTVPRGLTFPAAVRREAREGP